MDADILQSLDPRQVGRRLQEARRTRGLTQQDVADRMGMARTTITAIEKGERRVQPGELMRFATLYGRAIEEFLRQGEPVEAFTAQFRTAVVQGSPTESELSKAVGELQRLCDDYLELERICGAPLPDRYPPPYPVTHLAPEAAGEDIAGRERNRLGIGDGPLLNLRERLENDVGLRIFSLELPSKVAGLFAYTEQLGGCIAVNRKHPEERRRMTLAHEYGHFLSNRFVMEVTLLRGYQRTPARERLAEAFARNFLMPADGLRRCFHDVLQSRYGKVTYADLLTLAALFGVSFQAMVLRLEELRLVAPGTYDRVQRNLPVRKAQESLEVQFHVTNDSLLPERYQRLAVRAYDDGYITEGLFARFLRVDRLEARRIFDEKRRTIDTDAEGTTVVLEVPLGDVLPEQAS